MDVRNDLARVVLRRQVSVTSSSILTRSGPASSTTPFIGAKGVPGHQSGDVIRRDRLHEGR